MKLKMIVVFALLGLQAFAAELPWYLVSPHILPEKEIEYLHQLTHDVIPKAQWYGRFTFWQEVFEADVSADGKTIVFSHEIDNKFLPVMEKLASLWLKRLPELGFDIAGKHLVLESYLDRNVVNLENMGSSGMFWHRDSILVNGSKKIADYSMILLMNGKNQEWDGADLVLQKGGGYKDKGSYVWMNSTDAFITIKPVYNQAVIFRNSDTGHMVTPLKLLSDLPVSRDVFIMTCYMPE